MMANIGYNPFPSGCSESGTGGAEHVVVPLTKENVDNEIYQGKNKYGSRNL